MTRKNYQKSISRILIAVLIFMSALTYLPNNFNPYMISANAAEVNAKDELALTAIRNNYNSYMNGTPVDAGWGDFSSYDIYLLLDAGIAIDDWSYEGTTLESSIITLIDDSIAKETTGAIVSAKRVAQDYLGAKAINENEKAATLLNNLVNRQTAAGELDEGMYAIYSNMAAYDLLVRSNDLIGAGFDIDKVVEYVLGTQDITGAWPIEDSANWITNDFITTAEAVRVLNTLKDETTLDTATIETAINNGLTWLKSKQNSDGSFVSGYDDAVIDTSEIIYTALTVGEDPNTYLSGEGNSPVDYMAEDALVEGSFGNVASTTWALDAYLQLGVIVSGDSVLTFNINPSSASVEIGKTQQFTGVATKIDGTTDTVSQSTTWSASDETIATIDSTGLLTGVKSGSVIVTGSYASCTTSAAVTVNKATTVADNQYINVYILVLDENGDILYGPDDVRITKSDTYGETAMGVLDATGLDWKFSDNFDGMVVEIEGIKNSGMNGWMYSVNGKVPSVLAIDKDVESLDKVIWWYSSSAMEDAPTWPNSSAPPSSGSTSSSPIKDSLEDYSGLLSEETVVINQDNPMTDEELKELREKLDNNTVELNGDFNGSDMIMSDDEVSVLVSSGAYSEDITITAKELEESEMPRQFAVKLNSGVYEFGPNGTVFDEPIVISINIAIDESVDINKLAPAWYNEKTNEWEVIPCVIDVSNGMVTFEIDHFTKFALIESANRVSFDDVTKDLQWAKNYIEILAGQGLLEGTGNGFQPYKSMTRAEFVKLMVEALGYETGKVSETVFSDVSTADWFAPYVECATENGIIIGDNDGIFRPNDSISRYEVAVILSRLDNQSSNHITLSFDDEDIIPNWALDGVEYVSYNNIMNGYNNLFMGERDITRAEAAVVVYKYLNL